MVLGIPSPCLRDTTTPLIGLTVVMDAVVHGAKMNPRTCNNCEGKGKHNCPWCNGTRKRGDRACPTCIEGKVRCLECFGEGVVPLD